MINWYDAIIDESSPVVKPFVKQASAADIPHVDMTPTPPAFKVTLKPTLNELEKTTKVIDRRIKRDGNISESFSEEEVTQIKSGTETSYQRTLAESLHSLRQYRSLVESMGKSNPSG